MTAATGITIRLSLAERHVLADLLENFVHGGVWEGVRSADCSAKTTAAADRARRLAHLQALAEGGDTLPISDLDELRADLIRWVVETESTTEENDKTIEDNDPVVAEEMGSDVDECRRSIKEARRVIVEDYARRKVCESLIEWIDVGRERKAA